jgi:hypothetical protein
LPNFVRTQSWRARLVADLIERQNKNGNLPQDYRDGIQQVVEHRQKNGHNLYFLDGLKLINDPRYLMVID